MPTKPETGAESLSFTRAAKAVRRLNRASSWWERSVAAAAVGKVGWDLGRSVHKLYKSRRTYTVTVLGTDPVYDVTSTWLLGQIPDERRRVLLAQSEKPSKGIKPPQEGAGEDSTTSREREEDEQERKRVVTLRFDGQAMQTVDIGGHSIHVTLTRDVPEWVKKDSDAKAAAWLRDYERLVFVCPSAEARDALVEHLNELLDQVTRKRRKTHVYVGTRWGSWRRTNVLTARPVGSVVLSDGQAERIREDLGEFLAGEQWHAQRCLPWKRGYLFHGPAGTGKTSMVRAMADHFGLNLFFIPLGDMTSDENLFSLIADTEPRSILLLEDVDVFTAARQRDEVGGVVTLSGLLNALDGVATPHGLVTVMTTNELGKLDQALTRPGRIDRVEEFTTADTGMIQRLAEWFYGAPLTVSFSRRYPRVSPAQVIATFCQHPDDPGSALKALGEL